MAVLFLDPGVTFMDKIAQLRQNQIQNLVFIHGLKMEKSFPQI